MKDKNKDKSKRRLEDDEYFTPEMIKRIEESKLQIERGECVTVSTAQQITDLLKS